MKTDSPKPRVALDEILSPVQDDLGRMESPQDRLDDSIIDPIQDRVSHSPGEHRTLRSGITT